MNSERIKFYSWGFFWGAIPAIRYNLIRRNPAHKDFHFYLGYDFVNYRRITYFRLLINVLCKDINSESKGLKTIPLHQKTLIQTRFKHARFIPGKFGAVLLHQCIK